MKSGEELSKNTELDYNQIMKTHETLNKFVTELTLLFLEGEQTKQWPYEKVKDIVVKVVMEATCGTGATILDEAIDYLNDKLAASCNPES